MIKPADAFCAVGPDGKIDIDLLRRNRASCQHAATSVSGFSWPVLVSKGWRVVEVSVRDKGAPQPSDEPSPAPAPRAIKKPPPAKKAGRGVLRFDRAVA